MARRKLAGDDLAVRIVLRWLPDRKVWTIVGTRGTSVVSEEATTSIEVDHTDLIRLVGAVRDEIESWLPLHLVPVYDSDPPWSDAADCQADTPG